MSRTYEYRSGLASQISAFIAEKRACGCKYEKETKTFQTLDRFLVEQGINIVRCQMRRGYLSSHPESPAASHIPTA